MTETRSGRTAKPEAAPDSASDAEPAEPTDLADLVEAPPDAEPAEPAPPEPSPEPSPEQRIDTALIGEALRGRLEAFNELVRRHQDHLYALVYRLVPDPDQASDAVQEAFFSAYKNLASYRGGSVKSWLGRIAVNAAMDMQRNRKRRPWQPYPEFEDEAWQPPADESFEPEKRAITAAQSRALGAALADLPIEQRACIVLFDVQGYDYPEIARMMGISLGTVKSRIHRGRLALRQKLQRDVELFRG